MKKTLAALLHPADDPYRSIGELARTLQHFLSTAYSFRDKGRWGTRGPTEELCNYGGCVNCDEQPWHSGRITSSSGHGDVTTWQQNHDSIFDCIMASMCSEYPAQQAWRKRHKISIYMLLKFPMAYQHQGQEKEAWAEFMSLHKHKLDVPTLNSCHRNVNLLAAPQLFIGRESIKLKVSVTLKQEIRTSPQCYSRWDFGFLTEQPNPKWNPHRETFAKFLLRGTAYFKRYKGVPPRCARATSASPKEPGTR